MHFSDNLMPRNAGTHAEDANAADNGSVVGRGEGVVGGAEKALGGAAGGPVDGDSLGGHL